MNNNKLLVLGIPVHLTENYLHAVQQLKGGHIVTLNTEMVMLAQRDRELADIIHHADLVIPDGSGIVLYGRCHGYKIHRCPGIELAEKMLDYAHQIGLKVFFIGACAEVADRNVSYWQQRFPNLSIVGWHHGYFDRAMEVKILDRIAATQPDFVFVALGVPRQEIWIRENRSVCPTAIWMGVGGSFDVWAGAKKRAPQWLQRLHLEWFYRLVQEPWRWRRMLVLPQFVWQAFATSIFGRKS